MSATIFTYTIVRTPPQGFDGAPYCVAIVDRGGTLETARVSGYTDGRQVAIGDELDRLEEPDEHGAYYRLRG